MRNPKPNKSTPDLAVRGQLQVHDDIYVVSKKDDAKKQLTPKEFLAKSIASSSRAMAKLGHHRTVRS